MGMRVAEILENKEKGEVLSLSVRINRYRLMPILGQVNTPEELWGILDELDGKIIDDS
jgi:hypothetical protein